MSLLTIWCFCYFVVDLFNHMILIFNIGYFTSLNLTLKSSCVLFLFVLGELKNYIHLFESWALFVDDFNSTVRSNLSFVPFIRVLAILVYCEYFSIGHVSNGQRLYVSQQQSMENPD